MKACEGWGTILEANNLNPTLLYPPIYRCTIYRITTHGNPIRNTHLRRLYHHRSITRRLRGYLLSQIQSCHIQAQALRQVWSFSRRLNCGSKADKTLDRITFKNSPFYTVQRPLTNVHELKAREQTRDTVRLTIKLDEALAQRFQSEQSCKAFVFCAAEPPESAWKPVDIAFPHHAELKCNQEELKVSLKGLKNRPGSTRPVDITHLLRKKAGFPNMLEMVYALTSKVS